jgi:ribosomal protein S18 acetylase RimI-like enzyme
MRQSSTTIEFASLADAAEIAELSRLYIEYDLGWDYTPEKLARLIKSENKNVVIAREDNQLVGFGVMTYHEHQANLDLLAVKIRYRYQGIGKQIVHWLEMVALTAGIFNVYVQVRQINSGAIKFYKKLGYKIIDERRGYYRGRETAVIMSKDLRKRA